MENFGSVDLSAPPKKPSEAPSKEVVDIWIAQGISMHKVVASGDVTVIFSHVAGTPPDRWKMLAAPRNSVTDRATFVALYNSMTEFAEGQGWIEKKKKSSLPQKRTVTVPIDRLPDLQQALNTGNIREIEALGTDGSEIDS